MANAVRQYVSYNGEWLTRASSPTPPDTLYPPSGFTGRISGTNALDNVLTWVDSTTVGVDGYDIYWSTTSLLDWTTGTLLGSFAPGIQTATHVGGQSQSVYYGISAKKGAEVSAWRTTFVSRVPIETIGTTFRPFDWLRAGGSFNWGEPISGAPGTVAVWDPADDSITITFPSFVSSVLGTLFWIDLPASADPDIGHPDQSGIGTATDLDMFADFTSSPEVASYFEIVWSYWYETSSSGTADEWGDWNRANIYPQREDADQGIPTAQPGGWTFTMTSLMHGGETIPVVGSN